MTIKDQNAPSLIKLDPEHEPVVNHSDNQPFHQVLSSRMQRRTVMKGTMGAALAGFMGLSLAGCGSDSDDDDDNGAGDGGNDGGGSESLTLGFEPVAPTDANQITVPAGYTATVFLPWGTPVTGAYPDFDLQANNTGEQQEQQVGMHHDGMHYFPIDVNEGGSSSTEGLLVVNHEYIDQNAAHPNGPTTLENGDRPADEVRKEIASHGITVAHIKRDSNGQWDLMQSAYNRRITGATPMDLRGPVRGAAKVITPYSTNGTRTRGTLNNCAHGVTPWNTYMMAEENWHGYFVTRDEPKPKEYQRAGVGTESRYDWELADSRADEYVRFDATSTGASATDDYRNEPNGFGFMVEFDPFKPESVPQKRTALGKFGHEGVIFAPATEGEPVVCYSGDDRRFEYIYKFVSAQPYRADTANGSLLDNGTLYVARFNDDGSGEWLPLSMDDAGFVQKMEAAVGTQVGDIQFDEAFANQADLLLNTRLAADIAGATPMDRPEWGAVDPLTREVYFNLTNNSQREEDDTDPANPNGPNPWGHIIRWKEAGGDQSATEFEWDIFVFGGESGTQTVVDGDVVVELDESNQFNSPDGLWFDADRRLWIQTDGRWGDPWGNNMMLASNPDTREIKRFLVGPSNCEVTGVVTTPDQTSMFVGIQHPVAWPEESAEGHPRSSCVVITRDDGGVIGA
ncbi:PhoX family protein [Marinobacter zhanjiangensis]|uniref:Tat (Twin-arginine translocation) pathway signal sequence n=1 Tax=Marinobacter zhanjiangensis TaxID=578215 RepID=A0ABQ3B2V4_9GAMM|nr:PhoX family phosphatase [Marinobacter zhanjiangensis]GGY75323.1 hypothetical protein GCM10007071_23180 [Marinobacter zhanjiangensis]